jgi:glycosyltransferase involved in cell wall biosynthesis
MKVLLINPYIPEYRYHVFHLLATKVDLTIMHSGKKITKDDVNFQQIILPLKHSGPFTHFSSRIHKICKKFDVVISEGNIRHIDRNLLILNPFRKYKWITWGIGVSASYEKKYDNDPIIDRVRHFIFRRANSNVFYSDYPVEKYINAGFSRESLFVAANTTHVSYNEQIEFKKDKLLFVGTLYKQKRIYELLNSYKEAYEINGDILPLDIIGKGPEYDLILNWINENGLSKNIKLLGPIFDHSLLEGHFRTSLACISPGQAGLSVLTSMGYGTPYITAKNAIMG